MTVLVIRNPEITKNATTASCPDQKNTCSSGRAGRRAPAVIQQESQLDVVQQNQQHAQAAEHIDAGQPRGPDVGRYVCFVGHAP